MQNFMRTALLLFRYSHLLGASQRPMEKHFHRSQIRKNDMLPANGSRGVAPQNNTGRTGVSIRIFSGDIKKAVVYFSGAASFRNLSQSAPYMIGQHGRPITRLIPRQS